MAGPVRGPGSACRKENGGIASTSTFTQQAKSRCSCPFGQFQLLDPRARARSGDWCTTSSEQRWFHPPCASITFLTSFSPPVCLSSSVEARSVAQLKSLVETQASALPDAPVGTTVAQLNSFSKKKVSRVHATGISDQLPGDRENNEDRIKDVKFDLRWAKSIKEKHIVEARHLVPKADATAAKFLDFQAKSIREKLIKPSLFNA
jgi:hypothetical protein